MNSDSETEIVPVAPEEASAAELAAEPQTPAYDEQAILEAIQVMERMVGDRGLLAQLTREDRGRLLAAAGQISSPGKKARRQFSRAAKVERRRRADEADQELLAQTAIRKPDSVRVMKGSPPKPFPVALAPPANQQSENFRGKLQTARNCYVCKRDFDLLHFFYDALCPDCAEFNWEKRNQSADLTGRHALLTGGRVKIGFFVALKLLRAGAHLTVTTRFPRDAAKRFLAETDAEQWSDRLQVVGLDLRHLPSVEKFAAHLNRTLPKLDFVLNNACQTVRRPPGFYAHLMQGEETPLARLGERERSVLDVNETLLESAPAKPEKSGALSVGDALAGVRNSAQLTQTAMLPQDFEKASSLFPDGRLDEDAQQVDLREINSWRLKLAEVSTLEMLEVQLVNATAPFILNARLKPLMEQDSQRDRHIVNVSAMEGVFYRAFKRDTHPHTNMAKAALNMMTRTSAQDYVKSGIHMNSVDTGWITDEDPQVIAARKKQEHGFHPPLDHVDAAARICDPIFAGLNSGEHVWGKFLKDYQVANW